MNTKDKIIQTSISLFNEHGERAISTNHIASSLGMSPGNLYYHFKNKEDIVRHIFALYRDHLSTHFKPVDKGDDAFEHLGPYLDSLFELMWRYHFFYDNLGDILARDSHLKQGYIDFQQELLEQVRNIILALRERNFWASRLERKMFTRQPFFGCFCFRKNKECDYYEKKKFALSTYPFAFTVTSYSM